MMVQTIDEIKKHITIQKYKYIKQVDKIRQKDHHFTKNKTSRKANKRTNRQSFNHVFSTEPDRGGEG